MKNIFIFFVTLPLVTHPLFLKGQGQILNSNYLTTRYSLERMATVGVNSNSILPGLPLPPPDLVGNPFLNDTYNTTNLLLYNNEVITNIPCKLNLLQDELYLLTKQGLRVIEGNKIKSFASQDSLTKVNHTFINAQEFKSSNNAPLRGFFEILYDAPFALLKRNEAYIIESNYNVALNVGSRDNKIKKTYKYYYLMDGVTTEIPKKSITKIFSDKKTEVDNYIKLNNLNLKDERHLILVFEYFNQLK